MLLSLMQNGSLRAAGARRRDSLDEKDKPTLKLSSKTRKFGLAHLREQHATALQRPVADSLILLALCIARVASRELPWQLIACHESTSTARTGGPHASLTHHLTIDGYDSMPGPPSSWPCGRQDKACTHTDML